jgi:hypothetical protein
LRGVSNIVAPQVSAAARKLYEAGVNLTPGQALGGGFGKYIARPIEEALQSVPLVGGAISYSRGKGIEEFNKAAYKEVLAPINGKAPDVTGREGVAAVKQQISDKYDELLPKLKFQLTPELNMTLKEISDNAKNIPHNLGESFDRNIRELIGKRMDGKGNITGEKIKSIESDLAEKAKMYKNSTSGSEKELGDAYEQALIGVRKTIADINPQHAKELANINKAWANFVRVRKAGSGANTQDVFTPAQMAAAVRAEDKSIGKGQTATGRAPMQELSDAGASVLPAQLPNSGTVNRGLVAGGLATLGTGGAAAVNPLLGLVAGGVSLPYAPFARELTAKAMLARPEIARIAASKLRNKTSLLSSPSNKIAQDE